MTAKRTNAWSIAEAPRTSTAILTISHSYTYTVFMKNVTLSVDENILAVVRRYAAARDCSVNALVRGFLAEIAQREDRAQRARKQVRQLSNRSTARIGAKLWRRDELHER